jgi:hypothetical protein
VRRTLRLAALAAAGLCLAPVLRSQDSHYWTNQYGTRATLLGGTVIGSVLDLSGTYYNPGGLSLIEKPQTLMAAKVLQYPRVTLVGGERGSLHLNSANLGPAPSLIAGTFRLRGLPNHWFGYSFLSRQEVKLGVSISSTGVHNVLPDRPGDEDYATQYRLDEKMSEPWFGLTWSFKVRKNIGLGVSQYVMVRTHRGSTQTLVEALDATGHMALALGARQFHYQNFRLLWKVGLAFDFDRITLGLTLTTPSLRLFGTGSTGVNSTVVGLDMDGDGTTDDFMAASYSDSRPASYRTPLSIAAGATLKLRKLRVFGTAEWFARVRPYTVVDAEEFQAQTGGELLSTDVSHELASVLNSGFGLEYTHSLRFRSYVSYTTDRSARKPGTETNLSLTDWDIHHLMAGAEVTIKNSALTFGAGYSFGGREVGTRPEILEREGLNGLWDPFAALQFRYASYKLIVGFSF